jgi:trk system potassium uptake protein TrkA
MKVIVCGAGRVGGQIARRLAEDGSDVTVIDRDPNLVRMVTDAYDVGGVVGHGAHPESLERAGAADADMLIAATHLDEVNMMACQVAHTLFSVPRKIARVRAQSYLEPAGPTCSSATRCPSTSSSRPRPRSPRSR